MRFKARLSRRNATRGECFSGGKVFELLLIGHGCFLSQYTDAMLYNQLLYYRSIFDSSKALESAKSLSGSRAEELQAIALRNQPLYQEILSMLEAYLDKCGRRYVDLGGLFSFMNKLVL